MDYTILLQSETQLIERYNEFGAKTILNNIDGCVMMVIVFIQVPILISVPL